MKLTVLILMLAAGTMAASAQTPAKPATSPAAAKPASTVAHPATTGIKLPPGLPPVRGIRKTAFTLQYQDIKLGTGPDAEPNKMYKVHYTGWLAADGHKFDSSYDHPRPPVLDKDGKPVLDADGKPKQGDPQPITFPQGYGRLIPGWDQGFYGMKVGGKRRLFIPWELAYGAKGRPGPDAAHPGIPPKADLIFDVELVDVSDLPTPPSRPGMPPGARPGQGGANAPPAPGGANAPHPNLTLPLKSAPGNPAAPPAPGAPAAPATTGAPATPPAATAPAAPSAERTPATPLPVPPPPAPAPQHQ